jgi:hypothetical protein
MPNRRERRARISSVPATVKEGVAAGLERKVSDWRRANYDKISPEGSIRFLAEYFYDHIRADLGYAAAVCDIARLGHPSGDAAARRYIAEAQEFGLAMTGSLEDYNRYAIETAPLPADYPSQVSSIAKHAMRDVALIKWVEQAHRLFPDLPLRVSKDSICAAVGRGFGIEERQARRIAGSRSELATKLLAFMTKTRVVRTGALPDF